MSERPTDPAQAWRDLTVAFDHAWRDLAHALRIDAVALWLARQRWVIWLDAHLPNLPPWWRVWAWCAWVYAAVVVGLFAWSFLTGRLP